MLVTERGVPLGAWLDENRGGGDGSSFEACVVWGLHCLAEALRFLSADCKLLHGNLQPDAVWVTRGGSWKLAGLELCCALAGGPDGGDAPDGFLVEHDGGGPCPELYRSPERAARDWGSVAVARSAACLDAYSAGVLL